MKSAINFDTLEYMNNLKKGFTQEQAEILTHANAQAFSEMIEVKELATKTDIKEIRIDMEKMKVELIKFINENTWKTIGILATFQTLILTVFHFMK